MVTMTAMVMAMLRFNPDQVSRNVCRIFPPAFSVDAVDTLA